MGGAAYQQGLTGGDGRDQTEDLEGVVQTQATVTKVVVVVDIPEEEVPTMSVGGGGGSYNGSTFN